MITVKELIAFLQTQPQDLVVAFEQYSDWSEMELDQIRACVAGVRRGDGYIPNARPDKPTQTYLVFPGN